MAEMTIRGAVQNTRNSATDSGGYALPPLAANLKEGQIAVNTSDTDPCIFFKSVTGAIIKIPSEGVLVKALTDILGNSAADLDTLRELIALFEGSSKDILPMLASLTDKITAVEGTLTGHINNRSNPHGVTKAQVGLGNVDNTADSAKPVSTAQATAIADAKKAGTDAQSNLTSHVNNKANPHAVTAAQVGLGNVRNIEQLGKNETAVAANRIGPTQEFNDANAIGSNSGFAGFHATNVTTESSNYPETSGVALTYVRSPQTVTSSNRKLQLFSQCGNNELFCRFGYGSGSAMGHSNWFKMWHDGNSNKPDIDWQAKTLIGGHGLDRGLRIGVTDDYFTISKADTLTRFTHKENESDAVNGHGYFDFFVDSEGSSDKLRFLLRDRNSNKLIKVLANGNMGIGAPNPDTKLHLYQESGSLAMKVANGIGRILVSVDNVGVGALWMQTNNSLKFGTNNAEVARFTPTGYFGVGTNNPTDRVHAVGNIRATEKGIFGGNVESNGSGIFAGDIIAKKSGAVTFSASDAAAGATRLNDLVDVKIPTDISAKMVLNYDPTQVNSDGTTGGFTFSPAVGVGTGKVDAAVINSLPDHNHNDIIYTSDERLKENIVDLKGKATKIILSLSPKSFTWNEKARSFGLNDSISYGLIAQEVEKVMPELVKPLGKEDYIGVDYIKLVPILLSGVQEQHKEIIAINRKLDAMQSRANKAYGSETNNADEITKLKAEIEELKMLIKTK